METILERRLRVKQMKNSISWRFSVKLIMPARRYKWMHKRKQLKSEKYTYKYGIFHWTFHADENNVLGIMHSTHTYIIYKYITKGKTITWNFYNISFNSFSIGQCVTDSGHYNVLLHVYRLLYVRDVFECWIELLVILSRGRKRENRQVFGRYLCWVMCLFY